MKIKWLNTLFLDMEDRERERFFEESLKRLQSASAGGFEKLRNRCEIELQLYSSNYSTVNVTARADKFHGLKKHPYSLSILPSEYAMYVPIASKGDENCLYR